MQEKEKKMKQIEYLRQKLSKMINEKGSLLDNEILELSKTLDLMLNEYNELQNKVENVK